MRNITRLGACFIADCAAQTTSVSNVCSHLKCPGALYFCFTVSSSATLSKPLTYKACNPGRPGGPSLPFQIKRTRTEIDNAVMPIEDFRAE